MHVRIARGGDALQRAIADLGRIADESARELAAALAALKRVAGSTEHVAGSAGDVSDVATELRKLTDQIRGF